MNRPMRSLLVATAAAAALLPAAAAPAAQHIGQLAPSPDIVGCDDGPVAVSARVPTHVTPDGVVTSFHTENAGPAGAELAFRIFRDAGDTGLANVGSVPATLDAQGAATVPARIEVDENDRLGLSKPAGSAAGCIFATDVVQQYAIQSGIGPEDGMDTPFHRGDGIVNATAVVEPDADHDGFGDESQDGCPADPAVHGACLEPPTQLGATSRADAPQDDAPVQPAIGPAPTVAATIKVAVPSHPRVARRKRGAGKRARHARGHIGRRARASYRTAPIR
ncbi:MAG TPA: hypothetical protein VF549_12820 [Solirubrobacteraceae bacterium]|jgi:hypothetical protein